MKNVKKHQLCAAIVKSFDEYVDDIHEALGDDSVVVNMDGSVPVSDLLLFEILAKYYDVKEITSIHSDSSEYNAIWIAYKN